MRRKALIDECEIGIDQGGGREVLVDELLEKQLSFQQGGFGQ